MSAKTAVERSAFENEVERLVAAIAAAVSGACEGWDLRLAAGLNAVLDFLASDPPRARLLLVAPLEDRGEVRLAYESSVARLAEGLRPPVELTDGRSVSDEILLLQAHGIVSYLSGRILAGEAKRLPEAQGALLAYLGRYTF